MKLIPLTQGFSATVDDSDHKELSRHKWHAEIRPNIVYARRDSGTRNKKVRIYMHTQLTGARVTDHKDSNGLNNTRDNLRPCTQSLNCAGKRISKNNTSGFKGVSFKKTIKRWTAQIKKGRKYIHIGCFKSATEAAKAYDSVATLIFGEFAKTNKQMGLLP